MKQASACLAIVFAVGAAVQWNDPDPALWILAYVVGAGISLASALGRDVGRPAALAALVFLVAFLQLAPTIRLAPSEAFTSFEMQSHAHEEPREAVGLGLLAGWNGVLAAVAWRRRRSAPGASGPRPE